jgi:hypothetical protein
MSTLGHIFNFVFATFIGLVTAVVAIGFLGPSKWMRSIMLATLCVGMIQAVLITCIAVTKSLQNNDYMVFRIIILGAIWNALMLGRLRCRQNYLKRQTISHGVTR